MRVENPVTSIASIPQRSHADLQNLSSHDHPQYGLLSGVNSWTGSNTFAELPFLPPVDPIDPREAASKNYVDTLTTIVRTSGDQTVAGIKTFGSIPVLPASNPTTDNHAARKAYVDGVVGAAIKIYAKDHTQTQLTTPGIGTNLRTFTLAANTLGINGMMRVRASVTLNGSAGQYCLVRLLFGGSTYGEVNFPTSATGTFNCEWDIYNRNSATAQLITYRAYGFNGSAYVVLVQGERPVNHDTTTDLTCGINAAVQASGESVTLSSYTAEYSYSA